MTQIESTPKFVEGPARVRWLSCGTTAENSRDCRCRNSMDQRADFFIARLKAGSSQPPRHPTRTTRLPSWLDPRSECLHGRSASRSPAVESQRQCLAAAFLSNKKRRFLDGMLGRSKLTELRLRRRRELVAASARPLQVKPMNGHWAKPQRHRLRRQWF